MVCEVVHGAVSVKTRERFETIDITGKAATWLKNINANNGVFFAFVPHTTAAIAVNEAETGLLTDIIELLRDLTKPGSSKWRHNIIDNNAHAHLGNVLVGHSATLPVISGRLALGTWQRIIFIEMDGPRDRRVYFTFIGELD